MTPNTQEKFSSLFANTQGVHLPFIDSYAFAISSLEQAAKALNETPFTETMMNNSSIVSSNGNLVIYEVLTHHENAVERTLRLNTATKSGRPTRDQHLKAAHKGGRPNPHNKCLGRMVTRL